MIILVLSIYLEHNNSTWYNLGHVNKHSRSIQIAWKNSQCERVKIYIANVNEP